MSRECTFISTGKAHGVSVRRVTSDLSTGTCRKTKRPHFCFPLDFLPTPFPPCDHHCILTLVASSPHLYFPLHSARIKPIFASIKWILLEQRRSIRVQGKEGVENLLELDDTANGLKRLLELLGIILGEIFLEDLG